MPPTTTLNHHSYNHTQDNHQKIFKDTLVTSHHTPTTTTTTDTHLLIEDIEDYRF